MDPAADSLTPASIAFPTLALIALLFDIPPLVWHARNRNVAACNLISWTIFANLCNFVNALIWPTDNIESWFRGFVLCDIEAKLLLAATVGISGSLACIMRSLAKVLDTENTIIIPTKKQRYRELMITALLCFGAPVYIILIHYVVQPSRYYILAISGCTTSKDDSWVAIILLVIWPPILCLVAVYYALWVLFRLRRYRREFSSILSASHSNLTESRFLRVFLLSFLLVLILLPLQFYELYLNTANPLLPYSWDLVHNRSSWMDIIMVPQHGVVPLDRWMTIILGLLVFVFFGLGSDATKMYRKWWLKLHPGTNLPGLCGQAATSTAQPPIAKHDNGSLASLLSFCRKRLSWRQSSTSHSEKHHTATTITTLASPIEFDKMSRSGGLASTFGPSNASQPMAAPTEERPLPPVPAQGKPSWHDKYFAPSHDPSISNDIDIEAALERHDNHRPNRILAGFWHANNPAPPPATHGVYMGNCNGLRL